MICSKNKKIVIILAVFSSVTFIGLKQARAELVFEQDLAQPQVKNKKSLESTNANLAEGSDEIVFANKGDDVSDTVAPEAAAAFSAQGAGRDFGHSEAMRRQRLRTEIRNEDLLTEKLEELRLKDEMKRVDGMFGAAPQGARGDATPMAMVMAKHPTVVAPVETTIQEERIGSLAPKTQQNTTVGNGLGQSATVIDPTVSDGDDFDKSQVSITPRGGLASVSDKNFDISSRYAVGLGVGVDVSDYFTVEGGYTYSKFTLSAGNAYASNYNYNPYSYGVATQALDMNQHLIDLGVRVNVLGNRNRVRPFFNAGFGYYRTSINLDGNTLSYLRAANPSLADDYRITGFTGYVGTGIEFRVTRMFSLTGGFRYYNILSASQSNPISNAAFVNPNSNGYYGYNPATDTRQQASQALTKNNFYTLMAGVSVTF